MNKTDKNGPYRNLRYTKTSFDMRNRKSRMVSYGKAKVGMDNVGYENFMRRHGLGQRNGNDDRSANLYAFNKIVKGGIIFSHKRMQKAAWHMRHIFKIQCQV